MSASAASHSAIHERQTAGERAERQRPDRDGDRRDDRRRRATSATVAARRRSRPPSQIASHSVVVGCSEPRRAERQRRERRPAAQERGDRQRAQREGQLPRVEIALEAVGSRLGDGVAQRDRRQQRDRRPPVLVERCADEPMPTASRTSVSTYRPRNSDRQVRRSSAATIAATVSSMKSGAPARR